MRMMSSSTTPFDHAEAQREGWDVFKCLPDGEGRPQYQLQHLEAPEDNLVRLPKLLAGDA